MPLLPPLSRRPGLRREQQEEEEAEAHIAQENSQIVYRFRSYLIWLLNIRVILDQLFPLVFCEYPELRIR